MTKPSAATSRRRFLALAAGLAATPAFATRASASTSGWTERREAFPEGVASGDPDAASVLLWTRRPPLDGRAATRVSVEVAEDEGFSRVIARASAPLSAEADWTGRIMAGGLKPRSVYWYRFTDDLGLGSRIGRTVTAPADDDPRPARFAFVSCQNANLGAQTAYRRMVFEDRRAPEAERLGFLLHLGDFIYELVWYPEDKPGGYYDRRVREIVRYPKGEKITDFHVPADVGDYRAIYAAYLRDPDLQDARAWLPFVSMWDNHEFSWRGYQGVQKFFDQVRPAQTRKVAAMQAWFEYHPARVVKSSGPSLETFDPPRVVDAPIGPLDEHGLGQEPNNLAAIASLKGYRALRWGKNIELIITDQRSYRSDDVTDGPAAAPFASPDFPYVAPQDVTEILDAGRLANGGRPPETIRFGGRDFPNPRKDSPPQTMLGVEQKAWFIDRLKRSKATWKVWGSTLATLDARTDMANLPAGRTRPWPGQSWAALGAGDWSTYVTERGEIFDAVEKAGVTGLAVVSGDRHAFWAGAVSKALPPKAYRPVGVEFVVGSVSAPGVAEAVEHKLKPDHPLYPLYVHRASGGRLQSAINMLALHGVRACLELERTGDPAAARKLSNPEVAPHLSFADMGGHGYAVVRASADALETEFVCIPRPLERSDREDGAPLRYRVSHRVALWPRGGRPRLERRVIEGDPELSI